ncbi:MAG: tetratricopeptide repeat protein [Armatimonadota bacterium]
MSRRWQVALLIAAPLLAGFTWPGTVEWLCTRGVAQYREGEYGEATEAFTRALQHDPENATLRYNRGAALYREGRMPEAAETLEAAAVAEDTALRRDACYNLGNARFRQSDFEAAIEAYKEALRLDPDDMDAKHNLELAQRLQEQRQQQERQQQDQEQKQDRDQQDQDERQQQQRESQEGEEQQTQEQPDGGEDEQIPAGRQEHSGQEVEEGELTAAQARRLLRALATEDAEMQEIIRRPPRRREPTRGEKDW